MRGLALALVFALGVSPVVKALQGQDRRPISFGASVSIVPVPVYVLDEKGKAVPDLRVVDFEVIESGRPRPIVAFQAIDALALRPASSDDVPAATPLQASSRRQFLFLFDVSFARPKQLLRAREGAVRMVQEKLGPRDLVAVATASTRHGVKVLVGFTSDREQVARAIATLGRTQKPDPSDPLGLTFVKSSGPPVPSEWQSDASDEEDEYLEDASGLPTLPPEMHEFHTQRYLENLKQVARAVGGLQGRKQVVLFSPGFKERTLVGRDTVAGASVQAGRLGLPRSDDAFGSAVVRRGLDEALEAFAAADAVVHAVDVSGLEAPTDVARQGNPLPQRLGQQSLHQIANRSGGRLVKQTNNLALALGEVVETSRHFYVLGFVAEPSGRPGRYHEISVRVRRRGLHVFHRKGYVEPGPAAESQRLKTRAEAAEVLAKGLTGGEVRVDALAVPYRDAEGQVTLPVVLEVEAERLLDSEGAVELYVYAFDAQGRVSDLAAVTSPPGPAGLRSRVRQGRLHAATALRVSTGPHDVRYLVRHATTGRYGAGRIAVDVPGFATGTVVLHPPLFMDSEGAVLVLPSRVHLRPDLPFRIDAESFQPRARPRLRNGRLDALCVMFATLGAEYPPGTSFAVKVRLLDAQGAAFSPGQVSLARAVNEPDGFRRFKLEVTPRDVRPGEYTFEVEVTDPVSGKVSRAGQPIAID